jgi:hypothetical protein
MEGGKVEECLHSFSTSEPGKGDCSGLPTGRLYFRRIFRDVIYNVGPRTGPDSFVGKTNPLPLPVIEPRFPVIKVVAQ